MPEIHSRYQRQIQLSRLLLEDPDQWNIPDSVKIKEVQDWHLNLNHQEWRALLENMVPEKQAVKQMCETQSSGCEQINLAIAA